MAPWSLRHFRLTFCISSVGVVLRQLLQIVFEQHLVARDSLHGLEHVMLKCQEAAGLLTLPRFNGTKKQY